MQKPIGITVPDHRSTSYGSARVRPCRLHAVVYPPSVASHRSARPPLPASRGCVFSDGGEPQECSSPPGTTAGTTRVRIHWWWRARRVLVSTPAGFTRRAQPLQLCLDRVLNVHLMADEQKMREEYSRTGHWHKEERRDG
jgi:hypothetical protein